MPQPESGSIRREECSDHQHVEWDISYGTHKDNGINLSSPVFKIGTQMYFFQLSDSIKYVTFRLFRLGRSVDGPAAFVRYWTGLKSRDGTYPSRNFSDKLDLSEEFGLWTQVDVHSSKLEKQYRTLDRSFTFFFRMNVESIGAKLCYHDIPHQKTSPTTGNIREQQCSSHKQIEWEISYKAPEVDSDFTSPVFKIGAQLYFFETRFKTIGGVELHLFRLGRSVPGPVSAPRCWVGLKRSDGTYHFQDSHQLDLTEEFGLWAYLAFLMYIYSVGEEEQYLTLDSRLTFVFRMNTEPTGTERCTHDSPEMPSSVTGRIWEEECSSHKEVEWEIDYEVLLEYKFRLTSPVFKINTQMYYLELIRITESNCLFGLYRLGRSVEDPYSSARCWAGLKPFSKIHPLRNFNKKLDLHEDFETWTCVGSLYRIQNLEFKEEHLKFDPRIAFFFRMNVEPTGPEKCTHGPVEKYAARGEGTVAIQGCPSHIHVTWDVAYETSRDDVDFSASPVFKVRNQWYQLNLCSDSEGPSTLELYRSGSPVQGPTSSIRCWAGLKLGDGSYYHRVQKAELDLREECSMPAALASFIFPGRSDLERTHVTSEGRLIIFLQMDVSPETVDEQICDHGAVEMSPTGDGTVKEKDGKSVEWDVGYEAPREYTHISTSPVFKIGAQCYLLQLCYETDDILELSLYRFGSSVQAPARTIRCWAGLKRDRGIFHHNIEGVEIDLQRDCEMWTNVTVLGYFRRHDLEKENLTRDGRLKFFFLTIAEARDSHALQTNRKGKDGHEEKISEHSQDAEKLRQHFRLWLQHPEEGDRIRRLRREEFEAGRWKFLEKHRSKDKEPSIFAA